MRLTISAALTALDYAYNHISGDLGDLEKIHSLSYPGLVLLAPLRSQLLNGLRMG